jgi:lipopolysaccharide heptosyltransferase I
LKALVVRLSSIGDVIHTLPALAALRAHAWQVTWLVEPAARSLLEGHPLLEGVVALPSARAFGLVAARRALRELRSEQRDVALDFQGLWKSAAWARLSGARRVLGFDGPWRREGLSAVLLTERAELDTDRPHVIDKNLALLRALGIEAVGSREFPLPPGAMRSPRVEENLLERGVLGFAVLNPGGGWASKLWPPEGYAAVARGLRERGLRCLVTWGPGEERLAERVIAASEGAAEQCFATTLLDLAALFRKARLVVAADTGPLHLACAVGAPVVGIYGPTDPARNGPFSPRDLVVRRTPLCSPCHRRRCRTHDGVMRAITAQEVLRVMDARLGGVPHPEARAL